MDQESGNTADKRNWRERLGIGKPGTTAELPKISDEFNPAAPRPAAPRPAASGPMAHAPVKHAPMAPRMAPRPSAAPVAARPAAVAPPKPVMSGARATVASAAKPVVTAAARPAAITPRTPPVAADALAAKLKEQRDAAERLAIQRVAAAKQKSDGAAAPSGKPKFSFAEAEQSSAAASGTPKPAPAPTLKPPVYPTAAPVQAQPLFPQQPFPPAFQPSYLAGYAQQLPPSYRPNDPSTGFGQAPAFQPRHPAQPPMPQQSANLRPNPGYRPASPGLQGQTFQPRVAAPTQPRMPQMPMPQPAGAGPRLGPISQDDVFEQTPPPVRGQRRATASEYQQAYKDDLSDNYDQDRPRALGWILTAVILAALAGVAGWYYLPFNKVTKVTGNVSPPAIEAPVTPVKVPAEPAVTTPAPPEVAGKKLFYDRIEGDHEVPGAPLKSSEQSPNLQGGAAAPPAAGTGGAIPLPLPPPPSPGGQQGAIGADGKTDIALITPAAEQSSAANSSLQAPVATAASAATAAELPMPSGSDAAIVEPVAAPKPVVAVAPTSIVKKEPVKKAAAISDATATEKPAKSLGGSAVMLVPPSAPIAPVPRSLTKRPVQQKVTSVAPATASGGLYGNDAPIVAAPVAAAKPIAAPAAVQAPAISSGYQVQLASFASKSEATAEYQRLATKHGAIITRYAPLIEPAQVAGSTRYRLNLGPIANNETAQSVCSSLIAAGERDCLVHR